MLKSRKPLGKKLLRLLAEQVLPHLARDGRYDPSRRVSAEGEIVDAATLVLTPWETPTAIAARLGVSVQRVGRVITALGLRGADGLSRPIGNKAAHSARRVTGYLYSPEAVERIRLAIQGER